MEYRIGRFIHLASIISLLTLAASPVYAEEASLWAPPDRWFIYTVIFTVLIGSLLALILVRNALSNSKWSLADALSEEAEITEMETPAGATKPISDPSQTPVMVTELRASSSRLVAFMGMIVILLMFIGFGMFALYSFAVTGNMPASIDKVVHYLLAGLTLFAPYAVNKFSSVFEMLAPKKQ
ncbi:MAG: hypothetical protein ACMUIU_10555 [bacterium]